MKVEYVDHMGTDLSIANAARVSFHKQSEYEWVQDKEDKLAFNQKLSDADTKLLNYLAKNGHWSPFAHTSISLRFKAPIFIARQLGKHQVGLTWNEVSRRYVKDSPELYWPKKWRKAADNVKQGSSDEEYVDNSFIVHYGIKQATLLVEYYEAMIKTGLCPEQARMFLPQNMYTEWIWTGSIMAFARVYKQRKDSHAQKENAELMLPLSEICGKLFPVAWEVLTKE